MIIPFRDTFFPFFQSQSFARSLFPLKHMSHLEKKHIICSCYRKLCWIPFRTYVLSLNPYCKLTKTSFRKSEIFLCCQEKRVYQYIFLLFCFFFFSRPISKPTRSTIDATEMRLRTVETLIGWAKRVRRVSQPKLILLVHGRRSSMTLWRECGIVERSCAQMVALRESAIIARSWNVKRTINASDERKVG